MATFSGPSNTLGESLAKTQLFGSSSMTTLPIERTDCVSVSIARAEHYRSAADLWKQLFDRGLPNQCLEYHEIDTLLNRTGTYYTSRRYDSFPNGQTAFEALYNDWIQPSTPNKFVFGILCYSRHNTWGHCVNFINLGHEKEMMFLDFQNLEWSQHFNYAQASDCCDDVSKAKTIYIAWDRNRTSFERWEDDHNPNRRARAQNLMADGYNPVGYPMGDLNRPRLHSIYRYSAKKIISQLLFRPLSTLLRDEADLLRDLGFLTARGRTQIGNLAVRFVVEEQETLYDTESVSLWELQSDDKRRALAEKLAVQHLDQETGKLVEALVRANRYRSDVSRTTLNPVELPLQNRPVPDILIQYYMDAIHREIFKAEV